MKLVLVNPDYMLYGDPPLGLAYLAAYLKKAAPEIKVEILDQVHPSEILERIKSAKPDVIGTNAVSVNFSKVKKLGKEIKRKFNCPLIIGGVHITTSPGSFKDSPFDLAIIGEAEKSLEIFLRSLEHNGNKINVKELKKLRGFLLRDKNKIINTGLPELVQNLDEVPIPAREMLNMKYYSIPSILSEEGLDSIGSILTSRGCPYNCVFCSTTNFWTRKIRFFSAKRVVEEISELYYRYRYKKIYIYDDLFSINKPRIKEILKLLKQKGLLGKIKFWVMGRTDIFDEETAKLFKILGVKIVTFGFESGSKKTLKYLKGERITVQDSLNAIKLCKKYGIEVTGFFMVGNPYETEEDINQTYEFIKNHCPKAIVYQTIAFPGTGVWNYAVRNKILAEDHYDKDQKEFIDLDTSLLLTKEISKERFEALFHKIQNIYTPNKKILVLGKILQLRPRHIPIFFSKNFLEKTKNLRSQFIKRIFVKE